MKASLQEGDVKSQELNAEKHIKKSSEMRLVVGEMTFLKDYANECAL